MDTDSHDRFIDAHRALAIVQHHLQAIEHRFDATGEALCGDPRSIALDRMVTALGLLDEYLTGRSDNHDAIHEATNRLLDGNGVHLLVLSDGRSILTLDSFPSIDGFVQFESDIEEPALRWVQLNAI